MWMEQMQNGMQAFILPVIGTVFMLIAKAIFEKMVAEKKVFTFLGHFVPTAAFLIASSSKEVCRIVGHSLGTTEAMGFSILVMFGFMFLANTALFLFENFSDKQLKDNGDMRESKSAKQ